MGPHAHQPPPSAPWHLQLPKCSAFPADALKIHGPYGNSLAAQWLGAFTASPGSLVRELRSLMAYRETDKIQAALEQAGCSRHSDRSGPRVHFLAWPGQVHPSKGVQGGPPASPGRPPHLPPLRKPAAAWCRGLFLGVEGEGHGKRDRELGRWGREAQGVFLAAISYDTRDPRPLTPPLSWPLNYGAATENWPTHRSRALHPPGSGENKVLKRRG